MKLSLSFFGKLKLTPPSTKFCFHQRRRSLNKVCSCSSPDLSPEIDSKNAAVNEGGLLGGEDSERSFIIHAMRAFLGFQTLSSPCSKKEERIVFHKEERRISVSPPFSFPCGLFNKTRRAEEARFCQGKYGKSFSIAIHPLLLCPSQQFFFCVTYMGLCCKYFLFSCFYAAKKNLLGSSAMKEGIKRGVNLPIIKTYECFLGGMQILK